MARPKEEQFRITCKKCGKIFYVCKSLRDKRKYCSHQCFAKNNTGKNHYGWKGKIIDKDGYILVNVKNHPNANPNGYVREHRLVMEKYLGRYLERDEVVHHKNKNRSDNRIENLELFSSGSSHLKKEWSKGERKMTRWEKV